MNVKTKSLITGGIFFLAFFGLSTGLTYYLMPQKVQTVVDEGPNDDPSTPNNPVTQTHKDTLINSLVDQAMGDGLSLAIDQATLAFDEQNALKFDGAKLNLALGGLSIHGIDLTLEAPVDYNSKQRSLELALLDDNLYFSISNYQQDGTDYDFKYKVSTAAEDILDEEGNPQTDPVTGGTLQYEYGKLDWVIEDILSILSDGDINVPFPSIGDAISGTAGSTEESEASSVDLNAILASMEEMKEVSKDGNPYFQWDLEIAGLSLPIGLKADSNYNLTGVDLPYSEGAVDLGNGLTLDLSATVASGSIDWSLPYPETEYRRLEDSMGLFRGLAGMVAHPQFGFELNASLTHHEEAIPASTLIVGKDEINEKATLALTGQVDMDKRVFRSAEANLGLFVNDDESAAQSISTHLLNGEAYLNVNDVLKAKTSKVTNDELLGKIKDALASDKDGAITENQMDMTASAISAITNYLQGDLATGLHEGHYEAALELLKTIKNEDNLIKVEVTLEPIGIEGGLTLTLDGNEGKSLLNIDFKQIQFASFTFDGSLKTTAFEAPNLSDDEKAQYQEMTHLVGVAEQVEAIANSKQATLGLYLSVGEIEADATLAFDLSKALGALKMEITSGSENSRNTHTVMADLYSGTAGQLDEARLSYSSFKEGNASNPKNTTPLRGKMNISSLNPLLDSIMGLGKMEHRFNRLTASLIDDTSTSLLASLTKGQYFDLLRLHVIKSASIEGDNHVFLLDGSSLGLTGEITIKIAYDAAPQEGSGFSEGGFSSLCIEGTGFKLAINLLDTKAEASSLSYLSAFTAEQFTDLGGLASLSSYFLDTLTIGADDSFGVSTYEVEANLDIVLGQYELNALKLKLGARLEGAKTMVYAEIKDMPLIKGINAPEDPHYFRPQEYLGSRDVAFYFYADGIDPEGEVLMTRESTYGRLRNVKDALRLDGATFLNDIPGYLLKYLLGINESFFEGVASQSETMAFELPSLHPEDVLNNFVLGEVDSAPYLELGLDLGELTGFGFLGDLSLGVYGVNASSAEAKYRAIERISLDAGIALSGELSVCSLSLDAKLNNVTNGVYTDGFAFCQQAYNAYFINEEGEDVSTTFASEKFTHKEVGAGNYYLSKE